MVEVFGTDHDRSGGKSKRMKNMSWKKWLALLVTVAVIAAGAYIAYDYSQLRKENDKLSNPTEAAKAATTELVNQVGLLTNLPPNETPTVATVSDASKLQNQAFFKNAQNGDKVLIYTQAKRAILYRPSTNKVIEIAPINLGDNEKNTQPNQQNTNTNTNQNNNNR